MVCVPRMMRPKYRVPMFSHIRRRNKTFYLAYIISSTYTQKSGFLEVIISVNQGSRINKRTKIVSITAYYLDKLIFSGLQSYVIDSSGIHFPKSEFTALSNEPFSVGHIFFIELMFVGYADSG